MMKEYFHAFFIPVLVEQKLVEGESANECFLLLKKNSSDILKRKKKTENITIS